MKSNTELTMKSNTERTIKSNTKLSNILPKYEI